MSLGLTVVAPVYNEGSILAELAQRCAAAAAQTGLTFEVLLVDDASTDDTPTISAALEVDGLRVIRLPNNRKQFGATRVGLAAAQGEIVVVLDGDLQDPPERIPDLVNALRSRHCDAVFAVKTARDDPGWMRVATTLYAWLQTLGRGAFPIGAGSFSAMGAPWAKRVAALALPDANLAAALIALNAE